MKSVLGLSFYGKCATVDVPSSLIERWPELLSAEERDKAIRDNHPRVLELLGETPSGPWHPPYENKGLAEATAKRFERDHLPYSAMEYLFRSVCPNVDTVHADVPAPNIFYRLLGGDALPRFRVTFVDGSESSIIWGHNDSPDGSMSLIVVSLTKTSERARELARSFFQAFKSLEADLANNEVAKGTAAMRP